LLNAQLVGIYQQITLLCREDCIYNFPVQALIISPQTLDKLQAKHNVSRKDVEQCFANRCGEFLLDTREDHKSDPPTLWFVAPTNAGRLLKIAFIPKDGNVHLRSAFEPNAEEIRIYDKYGK
jgi:hypothetical protein